MLTGTLLRAGDQLRVTTQLVEAPAGTLAGSYQAQTALRDVFALQDDLARRIVESLALPLGGREDARRPDTPCSARAYEFYLRANELGRDYDKLRLARDLYLRCVEEDPGFAPAWARLGRCHRVIGKYFEDRDANQARAEDAFKRALELNPGLPLAHKLYAHLEAERGRARDALLRLVGLAGENRNDPELFAGLVLTCRYCGLLEASRAAHAEARRLDPHIPTSVAYTLWLAGDYEGVVREADLALDAEPKALALHALGRREDVLRHIALAEAMPIPPVFRAVVDCLRPFVEGRKQEAVAAVERAIPMHGDPEAIYLLAWFLARLGRNDRALAELRRAVAGGFWAAEALARDTAFDGLRAEPAFAAMLARAQRQREEARTAFRKAGGERLVGGSEG